MIHHSFETICYGFDIDILARLNSNDDLIRFLFARQLIIDKQKIVSEMARQVILYDSRVTL